MARSETDYALKEADGDNFLMSLPTIFSSGMGTPAPSLGLTVNASVQAEAARLRGAILPPC